MDRKSFAEVVVDMVEDDLIERGVSDDFYLKAKVKNKSGEEKAFLIVEPDYADKIKFNLNDLYDRYQDGEITARRLYESTIQSQVINSIMEIYHDHYRVENDNESEYDEEDEYETDYDEDEEYGYEDDYDDEYEDEYEDEYDEEYEDEEYEDEEELTESENSETIAEERNDIDCTEIYPVFIPLAEAEENNIVFTRDISNSEIVTAYLLKDKGLLTKDLSNGNFEIDSKTLEQLRDKALDNLKNDSSICYEGIDMQMFYCYAYLDNNQKLGASAILDTDRFSDFCKSVDINEAILFPSSKEEIVFIDMKNGKLENEKDLEQLKEITRSVNETIKDKSIILPEEILVFNANEKTIVTAKDYITNKNKNTQNRESEVINLLSNLLNANREESPEEDTDKDDVGLEL